MFAHTTQGRFRSVLGEHLIVVLIVGIVALAALATYPTLKARIDETAARVEIRTNLPLAQATELESGSPSGQSTPSGK